MVVWYLSGKSPCVQCWGDWEQTLFACVMCGGAVVCGSAYPLYLQSLPSVWHQLYLHLLPQHLWISFNLLLPDHNGSKPTCVLLPCYYRDDHNGSQPTCFLLPDSYPNDACAHFTDYTTSRLHIPSSAHAHQNSVVTTVCWWRS